MSDPWQEETEVEDDWDEELSGPVGGSGLFDEGEADDEEGDDLELWSGEPGDEDDDAA